MVSNGTFTIGPTHQNPLYQLRKHVDNLKNYLSSNHPYIGDSHKLIGYANIQYGFNKEEVHNFSKNWDQNSKNDFFSFHLFKDDLLHKQLDLKLAKATKFQIIGLTIKWVEDIVKHLEISDKRLTDDEIDFLIKSDELNRTAHELKELTRKTKIIVEKQKKIKTQDFNHLELKDEQNVTFKSSHLFLGLIFLGIVLFGIYNLNSDIVTEESVENVVSVNFSNDYYENEGYTNVGIQQAFLHEESLVRVIANVKAFKFDSSSGVKFIKLDADGFSFDGVIYKDIKTPFIKEGETYTFYGSTQMYEGKMELNIATVE